MNDHLYEPDSWETVNDPQEAFRRDTNESEHPRPQGYSHKRTEPEPFPAECLRCGSLAHNTEDCDR